MAGFLVPLFFLLSISSSQVVICDKNFRSSDGSNFIDEPIPYNLTELFSFSYPILGGTQIGYSHYSNVTKSVMRFTIFLPPLAMKDYTKKAPVLYFLPGLTSNEKTLLYYTRFQPHAAKYNLIVVSVDTSPRGLHLPGEGKSKYYGEGASWYVDTTREPWKDHYLMSTYITKELPPMIEDVFSRYVLPGKKSIFGHSMGGHGALITALRNPGVYASASAFAPVGNPTATDSDIVTLCQAAYREYLGDDVPAWREWDATYLVSKYRGPDLHLLVDIGTRDSLKPNVDTFISAANKSGVPVEYRTHWGVGHILVAPLYMKDHIRHHAEILRSSV